MTSKLNLGTKQHSLKRGTKLKAGEGHLEYRVYADTEGFYMESVQEARERRH